MPLSHPKKQVDKPKARTARRYSPAEKAEILEAIKTIPQARIHEKFGTSYETIRQWRLKAEKQEKLEASDKHESCYSGYHKNWQRALEIWKGYPGLGPAQIRDKMRREGIRINVATVRSILTENGYSPPKVRVRQAPGRRYEAVRPRELVHMDFKHFYINKSKAYLLLMQDDFSRFLCGHKLTDGEKIDPVIEVFEKCVARYGRMQTLMTDGGSAFYCWNGINRFQRLVADEYGIDQIKAGSPRSNGKVESVNKQFEKEILRIHYFHSLAEADEAIAEWVEFYNFERTHMGLPQGMVPADRFLFGWNRNQKQPEVEFESRPQAEALKPERVNASEDGLWEDLLKVAIRKLAR